MLQLMPRTSRISFAFLTPYNYLFNSLLLSLPCIVSSVSGRFYALPQARVADRQQSRKPQRNHARPNIQSVIVFVINWISRANLRGCFDNRKRQHQRRFQFFFGRRANFRPTIGNNVLAQSKKRICLFPFITDHFCLAENYDRAIIHRMMKCRTRQNQTINQCNRYANVYFLHQRPEHPACRRAMNQQVIADPRISGRNHKRLVVNDKPDVANKRFVKNLIDALPVIIAPLRQTLQHAPPGRRKTIHRSSPLHDNYAAHYFGRANFQSSNCGSSSRAGVYSRPTTLEQIGL